MKKFSSGWNTRRASALVTAGLVFSVAAMAGCSSQAQSEPASSSASSDAPAASESAAPAEEPRRIAFSHPYTSNPIRISVVNFAQQRADELGVELLTDESQEKADLQLAAVEAWLQQQVDAMVILPLEPSALEGVAKQSIDQGIPFISYAIPMENQSGLVTFPNETGGRILGEEAARFINEELGGQAKVALLSLEGVSVAKERTDAMRAALAELAPGAEIVATQDADTTEEGLRVTETILTRHPDLNVVLAMNDDGALGAYQAFINAGKAADDPTIFVGGMDSPKQALELVKQCGIYRASAGLNLKTIGFAVVDAAVAALDGATADGAEEDIEVPYELLTCESQELINQFLEPYGE